MMDLNILSNLADEFFIKDMDLNDENLGIESQSEIDFFSSKIYVSKEDIR